MLGTVVARLTLDRVQWPVLAVVQLAELPVLKLPNTRALATKDPELFDVPLFR